MIQETSPNHPTSLYIYTDQNSYEPLARIDTDGNYEQHIRYFHTDLNGCPEELTDENGKILWECSFQLWGKRIHEIEHEPIEQNLRYQGQYLDRETGLHYNIFRYYDPDIGRFTQPDPIGLLGGFNLYQYAPNGLTWIDPWGLACGLTAKQFKNKLKRIKNQISAGGNKGITGKVSTKEAKALGEAFVGPNYKVVKGYGADLLISEDKLRQYRGPSPKKGINKITGEPWLKTGTQINFQSRDIPEGTWNNNVHLDVEL
jgi:RHS repeat-associated protein